MWDRLAKDVVTALLEVGLPRQEVTAKKVATNKPPPEGILELWIEIPPR